MIGAAVLMAGILGLNKTSSEAADPVPEDELKALYDQDAKNIPPMIAVGEKKGNANISKATRSIKSNAMMIAFYANSRITGKSAAEDGKMAALRDEALKVALAAGGKNFAAAATAAKGLSLDMTPAKGAKAMATAALATAGKMDLEELMYQFKKTSVGGLGIEEEIKANGKKAVMSPAKITALATRVLAIADYSESVHVEFDGKKTQKDWDNYNKDMRTAAKALIAAANGKPKELAAAFTKLDGACVACHEKMK